jgi:two-component system, OmpR family, response regulator VanR
MRVLILEDEPYTAEAIRDGLRLEAIAADIAGDGNSALELLNVNAYDIAVLDRDIPGPSGELVFRLRALDRRRAHSRPPVREIAGLRLDPFRRQVYRHSRHVALTRKQFAVLEVLVAAEGGVVSAEQLLQRAWDENADPFINAVRMTVSALRKRLGEPEIIATVAGAGYRINAGPDTGHEGGERG